MLFAENGVYIISSFLTYPSSSIHLTANLYAENGVICSVLISERCYFKIHHFIDFYEKILYNFDGFNNIVLKRTLQLLERRTIILLSLSRFSFALLLLLK